jgi:hypothetical protein
MWRESNSLQIIEKNSSHFLPHVPSKCNDGRKQLGAVMIAISTGGTLGLDIFGEMGDVGGRI